jgi:large subunit ribosomal protein L9e
MRVIYSTKEVNIPADVTVEVKSRVVTVKGPKGSLVREFKHLALDMALINDGKALKVDLWFGKKETIACIR